MLFRIDVPDVRGAHSQMRDAERVRLRIVDVRQVSFVDPKEVDFQWIDRLQRLLPATLFHRHCVRDFFQELRAIHV
jgi:hypothetical protein